MNKLFIIILLAFLVIKIAFFFTFYFQDPSRVLTPDFGYFYSPAEALLELGRYSRGIAFPDLPEIHLPPGYPFFLAKIYSVFDVNQIPVILLQILLGWATIILTYIIAKKLWNRRIGLIGSVFLALDPGSFSSPFFVMTETLFTFLLLVAVFGGIKLIQDQKNKARWAFVMGLSLALTILVRPIAYYLMHLIGIAFFSYVAVVKRFDFKKTIIIGLLIAAPLLLLVGGWKVRNYIVSGSSTLAHVRNVILFDYKATEIIMRRDGISYDDAHRSLVNSLPPMGDWSEAKRGDFIGKKAMSIIKQYPLLFIEDHLYGLVEMMFVPYETDIFRFIGVANQPTTYIISDLVKLSPNQYINKWAYGYTWQFFIFLVMLAYLLFLYACVVVGLWKIFDEPKDLRIIYTSLCGIILYFLAFSESAPRFRVPIMPYLAMFGATGLYYTYKYIWRQIKTKLNT